MKPTKNRYFCNDCGRPKMLFSTEAKANRCIELNAKDIEAETGVRLKRSYFCVACGGWHVTSWGTPFSGESKTEQVIAKYHRERANNNPSKREKKKRKAELLQQEKAEEKAELLRQKAEEKAELKKKNEELLKEARKVKELLVSIDRKIVTLLRNRKTKWIQPGILEIAFAELAQAKSSELGSLKRKERIERQLTELKSELSAESA